MIQHGPKELLGHQRKRHGGRSARNSPRRVEVSKPRMKFTSQPAVMLRFVNCPSPEVNLTAPFFIDGKSLGTVAVNSSGLTHTSFEEQSGKPIMEMERRLSLVEELKAVVTANLQRATRLRLSILPKNPMGETT
jgi:hypothetical protein